MRIAMCNRQVQDTNNRPVYHIAKGNWKEKILLFDNLDKMRIQDIKQQTWLDNKNVERVENKNMQKYLKQDYR